MHAKLIRSKFEKNRNRLDKFYVKDFCVLRYKKLSFVIKIILTMSHGQAAVKGGFNTSLININNSTLKTNISPEGVNSEKTDERPLINKQLKTAHLRVCVIVMQHVLMMRRRKDTSKRRRKS